MSDQTPAERVARLEERAKTARPDWGGHRAVSVSADDLSAILAERAALLEALTEADSALANVTAFEGDARYIMGNTNFAIVEAARNKARAAITLATSDDPPRPPAIG